MPRYFNNCRRRRHAELFGTEAFYDLSFRGRQAKMAPNLQPGEECIVVTPDAEGKIVVFDWFAFTLEAIIQDPEDGLMVWVLFGNLVRSETLSKREAIASAEYSVFFNVKGHFKELSVIPTTL